MGGKGFTRALELLSRNTHCRGKSRARRAARGDELPIRSNAALVLEGVPKVGAAQVPALNRPCHVGASRLVEGTTMGRAAETLGLPTLARLERLDAPEARGGHGRTTSTQSAHTRAANRTTVAGSRIMLGSRRWRGAEPDCPPLANVAQA
jgi:hypothetical protein